MTPWLIGIIAVLAVGIIHLTNKLSDMRIDKEVLEAKLEIANMRDLRMKHKMEKLMENKR